jgi:hypothetical protein
MPLPLLATQLARRGPAAFAAMQRQQRPVPFAGAGPMAGMGPGRFPAGASGHGMQGMLGAMQGQAGNRAVAQMLAGAGNSGAAQEGGYKLGSGLAGPDSEELLKGAASGSMPAGAAALGLLGSVKDGVVEGYFGGGAGVTHKTMKALARNMSAAEALEYAVPFDHFGL